MPLKLLLDENLRFNAVWHLIEQRRLGSYPLDVVRVGDENGPPLGSPDDAIVRWAIEQGRILISLDASTLERTVVEWIEAEGPFPGLILLRKGLSVPETVDLLQLIAWCSSAEDWTDAVHWLP